jgi:hypothetical protein
MENAWRNRVIAKKSFTANSKGQLVPGRTQKVHVPALLQRQPEIQDI